MKITIELLNNELFQEPNENSQPTWYSRTKSYESDTMDEDIKACTISHYVGRIRIDDAQLTTQKTVDDMIEFLTNAKLSFKQ